MFLAEWNAITNLKHSVIKNLCGLCVKRLSTESTENLSNSKEIKNHLRISAKYFVNHSETIKFAVQFLRIYGKIGKECSK